jgi:hypothetical protein
MTHALLATFLISPQAAWACGGKSADASDQADCDEQKAEADPGSCAKRAELVGPGNCSWTTAMMAERVLDEGAPYTYIGRLAPSRNKLASRVAAPYTVGPESAIHVVANEIVDLLVRQRAIDARLELRGKLLEVDGIKYLVVTDFTPASS